MLVARKIKGAIIALVLIGAGAWLAHLHVVSQAYHPVVRVNAPEGLSYVAVLDPTSERQACGAANERFLRPVKEGCKKCEVAYARCERRLEPLEQDLYDGKAIGYHRVYAPGVRVAILGPASAAKATCEFLAADMMKRGMPSAACLNPMPGAPRVENKKAP
ncbi:MAG TPA: hypothetical protein VN929_00145 [Burkholderiales bacterium]|nr:hypothetical protein [Burkholderiales bacterium]